MNVPLTKVEVPLLLEALHGQLHLHHLAVEVLDLGLGRRPHPSAAAAVSRCTPRAACGSGGGPTRGCWSRPGLNKGKSLRNENDIILNISRKS